MSYGLDTYSTTGASGDAAALEKASNAKFFSARKTRKELMRQSVADLARTDMRESESATRERGEAAAADAKSAIQAQNQQLAQQNMSGAPMSSVSGRGMLLQKNLADAGGQAVAASSSAAQQQASAAQQAEKERLRQEIAQMDLIATQRAQFLGGLFGSSAASATQTGVEQAV